MFGGASTKNDELLDAVIFFFDASSSTLKMNVPERKEKKKINMLQLT